MIKKVIAIAFVTAILLVFGARGRFAEKAAIAPGTAYHSKYDIANKVTLNPVFTFFYSLAESLKPENQLLHLIDDQTAIKNVQDYLGADTTGGSTSIVRKRIMNSVGPKYNVVVVLMESMCAHYMQRFGDNRHLTPTLDSIARLGYSFDNFYSSGIHTFNGVFSTLYSFPALMAKHTMNYANIPSYTGLPYFMKSNGYKTFYFTTHDDQFDNIGGFLTANNIDKIYSQSDYPSSEVLSTLGIPDHRMFRFSLPVLDQCYRDNVPFFATMMTASNHPPFNIPDDIPFKPEHMDVRNGGVEYADWSISQFLNEAAVYPWFAKTIFVFLGDHGAWEPGQVADYTLTLNRIPCIIYSPMLSGAPKIVKTAGSQIDLFPILAGLLRLPYVNNTMGEDLLHNGRLWTYFSDDDKLAVCDTDYIYIWHRDGEGVLYSLKDHSDQTMIKIGKADSMRIYAHSMLQTSQWMLINKRTGDTQ